MASVHTPIQERFVEAYVSGASVADSLKAAGYAPFLSQGSKLLRKPYVQAAIAERQKRLRDTCHIEREDIAAMLMEARQMARTSSESLAATRQLGLLFGLFKDTRT